jgi:hypothetical protein
MIELFKVRDDHGNPSEPRICDAIRYEGKLWLVPFYNDMPALGLTKPGRIVRFDVFEYRPALPDLEKGLTWVIITPLPIRLFGRDMGQPPLTGFEILELPDISIPLTAFDNDNRRLH